MDGRFVYFGNEPMTEHFQGNSTEIDAIFGPRNHGAWDVEPNLLYEKWKHSKDLTKGKKKKPTAARNSIKWKRRERAKKVVVWKGRTQWSKEESY